MRVWAPYVVFGACVSLKKALALPGLAGNSFTWREKTVRLVRAGGRGGGEAAGSPLVLNGVQADVSTGNFCWCLWSDTFNNALWGRKQVVTNILVI